MAYNHGREDRKWRIWKEAEEKLLRECGVDEATIEQIRMADRADFNSNRRFYRWTNDVAEYLEDMAGRKSRFTINSSALSMNYISYLQNGGQQCPLKIVRCAALNMSRALVHQGIVLLVPRRYGGRNQTRANAGVGRGTEGHVMNCPQKMTD